MENLFLPLARTLIHLSAPDNVAVDAQAPVELSFPALATCDGRSSKYYSYIARGQP
jgi:hypothetical protein